jgi:mannose-6-phosphate isomerase
MSNNEVGKIYERPWGSYETLRIEKNYQIKSLIIYPGGRLSLQKHFKRSEHWVVVAGSPTLTVEGNSRVYQVNESVYIPREALHRIDDIVRIEDIYGRQS